MEIPTRLKLEVQAQPTDDSCGPTSLHSVYRYWRDDVALDQVIAEVPRLEDGGTITALLGTHALRRGYTAVLRTCNVRTFDPTWFGSSGASIPAAELTTKLLAQAEVKPKAKTLFIAESYRDFLSAGGRIRFEAPTTRMLARILRRGTPILVGLSATYLHGSIRERREDAADDDVGGYPVGHFVVLHGYDPARRIVMVADPLGDRTKRQSLNYEVSLERLIAAILLGAITYDGTLLVIEPANRPRRSNA